MSRARKFGQRCAAILIAATLTMTGSAPIAAAQNLFEPVARVNESVVTRYELQQRIRLLDVLNAPGDPQDIALDQLIDERLQRQAAEAAGVEVGEDALASGLAEFAARGELSSEEFMRVIGAAGVAEESFRDFLEAGLAWREVVRARFAPVINVTAADIDKALSLPRPRRDGIRVLLSEIFLPTNTPQNAARAEELAARISQIRSLPEFAAAAREVSASRTRDRGGRLDWIPISNLPPPLIELVLALEPGEVTAPFNIPNAIALFQLRAIEEVDADIETPVALDYAAFYIPGGRSPAALQEASRVAARAETCDDLYGIAEGLPAERLDRRQAPIDEVPRDIALELARLDPGEASTALTRANGQTLVFLMLCGRTFEATEDLTREGAERQVRNERLSSLADAYLAELRANAVIVIEP